MTTPRNYFQSEIGDQPIAAGKLAYFRARLGNRLHQIVLERFIEAEKRGLSRATLARRIGKRPEQLTRYLSANGNWTLDTVSDLLLGLDAELSATSVPLQQAESDQTVLAKYFEPTNTGNTHVTQLVGGDNSPMFGASSTVTIQRYSQRSTL